MNLTFDSFKITQSASKNYLYADLHLDLAQQQIQNPGLRNATIGKDIKLDYDIAAVLNALNNLFNTLPGQRFLIPTFGLNLMQYVFTPVSKAYGETIGSEILTAVSTWEPRVQVTKILINALPEQNEYDIALALYIPVFKYYTGVISKLAQNGFAPLRETLGT